MNDKVKTLINVLPIFLIPLFTERNRIKEHPDMEKLGSVSKSAYTTVKDKGVDTASTIKDKSTSAYTTGREAAGTVGSKISETRHDRAYKKDIKSYQKSLEKEDKLHSKFEKEKEKHRKERLNKQHKKTSVPKIMQSQEPSISNEEKMAGMTVSDDVRLETGDEPDKRDAVHDHEQKQITKNAELHGDDEEQRLLTTDDTNDTLKLEEGAESTGENEPRLELTQQLELPHEPTHHLPQLKEENTMPQTTDVQEEYFKRTRGTEDNLANYEDSALYLKHREALAPTLNTDVEKAELEHSPLFEKHRAQNEAHIQEVGRRSGIESNMKKNKAQLKLEKKINRHRRKDF